MNLGWSKLKSDAKICFKFFKIIIVFMCFSSNYKNNCRHCLFNVDIVEKLKEENKYP